MRYGIRKPSIKKVTNARTTGKVKRIIKKLLSLDMDVNILDGLKILKKQHIIQSIIQLRSRFLIYSNYFVEFIIDIVR